MQGNYNFNVDAKGTCHCLNYAGSWNKHYGKLFLMQENLLWAYYSSWSIQVRNIFFAFSSTFSELGLSFVKV